MPKRSLSVRKVTFQKKYDRSGNPEQFSPADLDGKNLLDLFDAWMKEPNAIPLMEPGSDDCVVVKKVSRPDKYSLFIDTNSGKRGEEGDLYRPDSSRPAQHINEEDAATGHTRALLYVPERGRNALLFSEHCLRGTAGKRLLDLFSRRFAKQCPSIKLKSEYVCEGPEWLEHIKAVKSIEIRAHRLPKKSYDALGTTAGSFNLEFKPDTRRSFPIQKYLKLREAKDEANILDSVFGIPELDGEGKSKLLATVVGNDDRTKKVDFDKEVLPHFLRTLSENGDPEISDDEFIQRCFVHADEILKRIGE